MRRERSLGPPTPAEARACLARFLEAASALDHAWHPILESPAYPSCLPDYTQFMNELMSWRDEVVDRSYGDAAANLSFTDRAAVKAWFDELCKQIDAALFVGEDATRPLGQRALGRAEARRRLLEASHVLHQLVRLAMHGLDGNPPPPLSP
jgi:hypothetical protein